MVVLFDGFRNNLLINSIYLNLIKSNLSRNMSPYLAFTRVEHVNTCGKKISEKNDRKPVSLYINKNGS